MPAEAYRAVQAWYTFERPLTVLFMDDSVLALARGSDPSGIGMKPLPRLFADLGALPGISFLVHRPSLEARGLSPGDLEPPVEGADPFRMVDDEGLEAEILSHKAVVRL